MPKKENRFSTLEELAITTPSGLGVSYAFSKMRDKGILNLPQTPTTPKFISNLQHSNLQSNLGIDPAFFGQHQGFLKTKEGAEAARTAWIGAVQSTDPLATDVLSFAGDMKGMPSKLVIPSIEQTLQRNNSIFMARMYNKFKSNVSALRKHYELTGNIPKFKAVEGLKFPAARNMSINSLPEEFQAFHKRIIKDVGLTGTGVKYYTRAGWEGYGTYVMGYMKGKMPFDITVPVSKEGVLMEGLTQSARRIAPDVGILDPRSGDISKMSRHEFFLKDIEKSVMPRIGSGEYKSAFQIQKAIGGAYEKSIRSLEAIPNLPGNILSPAWKSYQRIKGKGLDVLTEGKLSELRPGEFYSSTFQQLSGKEFKQVMGKSDIYPFSSPSNLAKGRVSSFNAADWSPTPSAVDWGRSPRQALRHWRADDKAISEMLMSGSSKWSIFETQAWRKDFGNYSSPWIPTVYIDPSKHGAMLEQIGMKDGEALIADIPSFRRQLGVTGQPFPKHLGSVVEGLSERIKSGDRFQVGEILGQSPEGKAVAYKKGMKLLGLQSFETVGKGQEFALMLEQTLEAEEAGKYFKDFKAVQKFTNPQTIRKGLATTGMGADISRLEGKVRIVDMGELRKDRSKFNTQITTGLYEKIERDRGRDFIARNRRLAAFMRSPRVYESFMWNKYGEKGFTQKMMRLAVKDARFTPEEFGTVFGAVDPSEYKGIIPEEFLSKIKGISYGRSQGMFHASMEMTGAGALGSIEPRFFDILKGGQYGALGGEIASDITRRLALTNPQKVATYEALTKTLGSLAGGVPTSGTLWDISKKGYSKEAYQSFIEAGGGTMKLGSGLGDVFVPGGDVLIPFNTAAGKKISGDLAMEYHNLARETARLYTQSKRIDLDEAGKLVDGFIRNIGQQQAPFGKGAGAVARGQVLGSMYFRGVSEIGGQRPLGVMTGLMPQQHGEQLFEDLASIAKPEELEGIREMNKRFLAGEPVGAVGWRHPGTSSHSIVPLNVQMVKGIKEPVFAMPSRLVDIGMKNPIQLSPMVGLGMDLDADIVSVSLVNPDLEKKIRKGFTSADNEFTRAYTEHQVRAQIIKTKAAGGAEVLSLIEKKTADAMKLATGQEWIGKLSEQMSVARRAVIQRTGGQQAANATFMLNWLEESILKSKHLSGERVLSGEFSALLGTAESAFEARDAPRLENVMRQMLAGSDETARALLDQDVRITKNVQRIREITGVKSFRDVLPGINLRETSRDIMNSMEVAETSGVEEMAKMASGRRGLASGSLSKYLSYTGSVMSKTKGVFAGVSQAAMASKNVVASVGMGLIQHKKALGFGFAASLAIGAALSRPIDSVGSGASLIPDAKTSSEFNKAAMRMTAENVLPPEAPLGEPTVPPMMNVPTARVLPGAEMRNINIRARSSSNLNVNDMINQYSSKIGANRMNINVRDSSSTLNKYTIADRILK